MNKEIKLALFISISLLIVSGISYTHNYGTHIDNEINIFCIDNGFEGSYKEFAGEYYVNYFCMDNNKQLTKIYCDGFGDNCYFLKEDVK